MTDNETLIEIAGQIAADFVTRLGNGLVATPPADGVELVTTIPADASTTLFVTFAGPMEGAIALSISNILLEAIASSGATVDSVVTELATTALTTASLQLVGIESSTTAEVASRAEGVGAQSVAITQNDAVVAVVSVMGAASSEEQSASDVPTAEFESFDQSSNITSIAGRSMDLLNDVEMGVAVELGRTRMSVREILNLTPGSVVELDRAAGSPVDLLVNGTLVAKGEVVVIDEEFGIRITEILGHDDAKRVG